MKSHVGALGMLNLYVVGSETYRALIVA